MIAHDESAFRELFVRYRSTLYATAYAALLDPEQVEAAVADAFEQARRTAASFLGTQATVCGWLTHLTRCAAARPSYALPRGAATPTS